MSKSLTAFTGFRPLIRGFFFYDAYKVDDVYYLID